MDFAIKHDLGIIRAMLLAEQGKYGEAIKMYLHDNQETEALDIALEHVGEVTLDADAFQAIERKLLWRYFSFGSRGWPENAAVPADKVLALLGTIPRAELNDRDQKVVSGTLLFSVRRID
jgi:hypothetical protein